MPRSSIVLVLCTLLLPAAVAVAQTPIYTETFNSGLGSTTAINGGGTLENEWYFEDMCPENAFGGHSAPGAARWGNPASCGDYGTVGIADLDQLVTDVIDVSQCEAGTVDLSVNYLLGFTQSSTYDDARISYSVDGGAPTLIADNGDAIGNLVDNPQAWQAFGQALPDGSTLEVIFDGETVDSIGNLGPGFYIDDIEVSCILVVVPTAGPGWLALLVALLLAAGLFALYLKRSARTV